MNPAGLGTKNVCDGEDQQQFISIGSIGGDDDCISS
jgi:hypothetical protein